MNNLDWVNIFTFSLSAKRLQLPWGSVVLMVIFEKHARPGTINFCVFGHVSNPGNRIYSSSVTSGVAQMEGNLVVGEIKMSNLMVQQLVLKKPLNAWDLHNLFLKIPDSTPF